MKYLAASLILLLATLSACGPSPQPGDETRSMAAVRNFQVQPDHEQLTISWDPISGESISGYNIYIVPDGESLDSSNPVNAAPFPGDTSPEDNRETFEARGLSNGVVYTVWVRVVYPGGLESAPTERVSAVCGGRGEMALGVRYDSENDGFSFANDETVRANDQANDLYYVSVGGVDYLASPTRLDGFLRVTTFVVLPYKGSFDEISAQVEKNRPEATEERVIVAEGDWVLLRTADNAHTLLNVRSITGADDDSKEISLFYAYSSLRGRLFF